MRNNTLLGKAVSSIEHSSLANGNNSLRWIEMASVSSSSYERERERETKEKEEKKRRDLFHDLRPYDLRRDGVKCVRIRVGTVKYIVLGRVEHGREEESRGFWFGCLRFPSYQRFFIQLSALSGTHSRALPLVRTYALLLPPKVKGTCPAARPWTEKGKERKKRSRVIDREKEMQRRTLRPSSVAVLRSVLICAIATVSLVALLDVHVSPSSTSSPFLAAYTLAKVSPCLLPLFASLGHSTFLW